MMELMPDDDDATLAEKVDSSPLSKWESTFII